jgi:hypothetical protein
LTAQQYLEGLLEKYKLTQTEIQTIQGRRDNIEAYLRKNFPSKIKTVYNSGSYAKETAINLKYDYDVCIYFNPDSFSTLKEMYNSVYESLKCYGQVTKQKVSIRLTQGNASIDVVPGRSLEVYPEYANLFVTSNESRIQTNIPLHKRYISESGCRPIIKLMKIWKIQKGIHYKSFALELLTIQALKNNTNNDYGYRFQQVLDYVRKNVETVRLEDPANSSNNVSDYISVEDKKNMKRQAEASFNEVSWGKVIS